MLRTWSTRAGLLSVLLLSGAAVRAVADDAASPRPGSLAELQQEHRKAMDRLRERQGEAKTESEREAAQADVWREVKSAASRAFDWAETHPDDPEAIDAVVWTIHGLANGYYPEFADEIRRAFTYLTEKALASEKIVPVCYYADGCSIASAEALHFLEKASTSSPNRLVRGTAILALARHHRDLARLSRRLEDPITARPLEERWAKVPAVLTAFRKVDIGAETREAASLFDRVVSDYGDLKMPSPYNETPFAEMARGESYAMTNLSPGKLAPEIVGEGVDGKPIRLSDHRGKVVVLVFWATWCGPCMAMVPHERELVKRLAGQPFLLIGVNGDEDRAKARETMAKESMTWPSLWNGGPNGEIATRFGVSGTGWPTIYVLDARGVIRYHQLRGEMLDAAVDKLLAEKSPAK